MKPVAVSILTLMMMLGALSPAGNVLFEPAAAGSGSDLTITTNYTVSGSEVWDHIIVGDGGKLYLSEESSVSCLTLTFLTGSQLEVRGGEIRVTGGRNATVSGSIEKIIATSGSSIRVEGSDGDDSMETSMGGYGLMDLEVNGSVTIESSEFMVSGGGGYDLPASTSTTSNTWSDENVTGSVAKGGNATMRIRSNSTITSDDSYMNVTGGSGGDAADGGDGTTSKGGKGGGYSEAGVVLGYVGSGGNASLHLEGSFIGLDGSNITVEGGKGGDGGDGGDGGSAPSSSNGRGGGGGGYGGMSGGYNSGSPVSNVSGHVGKGGYAKIRIESLSDIMVNSTGMDVRAGVGGQAGDAGSGGSGSGAYGGGAGGGGYGGGGGGNGNGYRGGDGKVSDYVGSGGLADSELISAGNVSMYSSDFRTVGGDGGDAGRGGRGAQSQGGGGGGAGFGGGGGSGGYRYTPGRGGNGYVSGNVSSGGNSYLMVECGNLTLSESGLIVRAGEGGEGGRGGNGYITGGGGGGYGGGGGGGWESGDGGSGYVSENVGVGGDTNVDLAGSGSLLMNGSSLILKGGDGGDGGQGGKVYVSWSGQKYYSNGAGGGGYTGDGGIRNYHKSGDPGKGNVKGTVGDGGDISLLFDFDGIVRVLYSYVENIAGSGGYAPDSPGEGYSYSRGAGIGRDTTQGTETHDYGGIPTVVDINLSSDTIHRSEDVVVHVNSTDDKTDESGLESSMRMSYPNGTWTDIQASYNIAVGCWEATLDIPTVYPTGEYTVGAFFSDPEGNTGPEEYGVFTVLNNLPLVNGTKLGSSELNRSSSLDLEVDLYDMEDAPENMSCQLQYRPAEGSWEEADATGLKNGNFTFSVFFDKGVEPGFCDIRTRGEDKDGAVTDWYNMHDVVLIKNRPPRLGNVSIPVTHLLRGSSADIIVEIIDFEDPLDDLEVRMDVGMFGGDWFEVNATGLSGDNLTFRLITDENWTVGIYQIRLKYVDSDGDGDDRGVLLGSIPVLNNPPEMAQDELPAAREDREYNFGISYSDPDSEFLAVDMVRSPEWIRLDGMNLTGTPRNQHVGEDKVVLTLDDGNNVTVYDLLIDVENTNDPPVIDTRGPLFFLEDELILQDLTAHDEDPTGDELSWKLVRSPDFISLSEGGQLSGTPGNGDVGSYSITVEIMDGRGGQTTGSLEIVVVDVNDPPSVVSDPSYTVNEDEELVIDLEAQDIDDPAEDVRWDLLDTGFMELENDRLVGTPSDQDVGAHFLNLSVTDQRGKTTMFGIEIFVLNVNDPPEITFLDDVEVMEDEPFEIRMDGKDPDLPEDELIWALQSGPEFIDLDEDNGLLSGTPKNGDVGIHTVVVSVIDNHEGADKIEFRISVINVNDPPVILDPYYSLELDEDPGTVGIDVFDRFTDPDGDPIFMEVLATRNISVTNRTGSSVDLVFEENWFGSDTVKILCTDGHFWVWLNMTVDVRGVNDPPSDVGIQSVSREIVEGEKLKLSAIYTDPDDDHVEFSWSSDKSGVLGEGEVLETELPAGKHSIELSVTDPDGERSVASIRVTVHPVREDVVKGMGWIPFTAVLILFLLLLAVLAVILIRKGK